MELTLARINHYERNSEKSLRHLEKVDRLLKGDHFKANQYSDFSHNARGQAYILRAYIEAYINFDKPAAITFYQKAMHAFQASATNKNANLGLTHNAIGMTFSEMGDFDNARKSLEEALAIYVNEYGESHLRPAETLHNIARLEFFAGNIEQAASAEVKAISIFEKILEPNHPTIATAYLLLGQIKNAQKDFPAARRALLNSASIFQQAYGETYEMTAVALIYLSKYEAENGLASNALNSLDKAQKIYDALYPRDHANHGDLLVYKAYALKAAGNHSEAIRTCARGLAIMEKSAAGDAAWLSENREICQNLG